MIDIPGVGNVEAKNAASEKTLQDILKILDEAKKSGLTKPDKDGGSSGGGKESKAKKEEEKQSTSLASSAGYASGKILNLAKSATMLIQDFANVGDSVTAAAGIFAGIPVIGPIFGAVAQAAEQTTGAFQKATASGANFGGSITEFSRTASNAGMTMAEFAGVVANNGEAMMLLGGTTADGAKRFGDLGKEMKNSQIGQQLYGLGMTTAEVNGGMASYIKMMGNNGALQGKSTKEIAAGAGAYLKELDGLAKITGQTREEKMKEQEAMQKDAQFRAATASMDAESKANMMNFITSFPKEQQAAVKDMIATGNITSDAAVKFNAQMGGTAQEVMKMGQIINSGGKVSKAQYDSAYKDAVGEAKQRAKSQELKTMGQYAYNEFGESVIGVAELAARDIDGKQKAMTAQEKAAASQAAAMEKNKQDLAALSNSFQMALANSGILTVMMGAFKIVAGLVMDYVVPAFNIMSGIMTEIGTVLLNVAKPAFEAVGTFIRDTLYPGFLVLAGVLIADVLPIMQEIATAIGEYVIPVLTSLGALINEYVMPPLEMMGTWIADNLTPILLGLGTVLGAYAIAVGINTALTWVANGGLTAMAAGLVAVLVPLLPFALAVAGLVYVFKQLYDGGWTFSSALDNIVDNMLNLLNKLTFGAKGISDDELKARQEKRDLEREKIAEERSSEEKKQKRAEASAAVDKKVHQLKSGNADKLEAANKKEESAKSKEAELNYNDPVALLQGAAAQQKSAFIKDKPAAIADAEATKKTIESKADESSAAKEAAAKEAAAKEAATKKEGSSGSGSDKPAQESPATLLADLNSKMDQLIKINKDTHGVSEEQLRVQRSLSQDQYA